MQMTLRTEANSLKAFIEKRWAEARTELEDHDPAYVRAVEALDNLQDKLTLPSQISSSSYSLPRKWVDLLESTLVVSLALEDLHLAVSLLNPDAESKVAHWYLDVWMQFAFNLVEKVKVLVSFTCGVHGLGSMKDRYRHRLDSEGVQGQLRQRRDPLVHGAGGEGSIVRRAITEDLKHPWELSVAHGPRVIDAMLQSGAGSALTSEQWRHTLGDHSATLLGNIGKVLDDLEEDIDSTRG